MPVKWSFLEKRFCTIFPTAPLCMPVLHIPTPDPTGITRNLCFIFFRGRHVYRPVTALLSESDLSWSWKSSVFLKVMFTHHRLVVKIMIRHWSTVQRIKYFKAWREALRKGHSVFVTCRAAENRANVKASTELKVWVPNLLWCIASVKPAACWMQSF